MKRFIGKWLLLAALAALVIYALKPYLGGDAGQFILVYQGQSFRTTLWFALTALALVALAVWFFVRAVRAIWRLSRGTLGYLAGSSERKAQQRTHRGLVAFMEGNWQQAKRNLLKSAEHSPLPLVNYLAAARSTYELGEREEAMALLHKAEQIAPERKLAVALTQARMLLAGKQYESCIATLRRAQQLEPEHPVVLALLLQVYEAVNDWAAIGDLLPDLRKHKILPAEQLQRIERDVHRALIAFAGERAKRNHSDALAILQQQWREVPAKLQQDAQLVHDYCHQLLQVGGDIEAEELLRHTLKRDWHDQLVALYGRVKGADVQRQLLSAESWLKQRPNNAALLLALGRLSLRAELWGKAREYFEHSLQQLGAPETYAELARLQASLGEHQQSTDYYQRGLLLSTDGLPDLPQPVAAVKTQRAAN